jgi:bifunctional enzyme CysN/CysC
VERQASGEAGGNGAVSFHEVYIKASLEVCEERDPKGLYRKARAGEIAEFTGISSPYEAPDAPEFVVRTDLLDVEACLSELLGYVEKTFAPEL